MQGELCAIPTGNPSCEIEVENVRRRDLEPPAVLADLVADLRG
jgi:hypothetical protein